MAFVYWVSCWIGELRTGYDARDTHVNNYAYSVTHSISYGDRDAHTHVHSDIHTGAYYDNRPTHGDTKHNLHGNP